MTVKFTAAGTYTNVVTTELNALADDSMAVAGTPLSNDVAGELDLLANFKISLASFTTGATTPQVSLLIVPDDGAGTFSDVASIETARNHIARYADGTDVTFTLDVSATGAVTLIATGVQLPNANYKPGLLNESGASLAATGNTISTPPEFSMDDS